MSIQITVVYAPFNANDKIFYQIIQLSPPYTVAQALSQSQVCEQFPEIQPGNTHRLGIFGRFVKLDTLLSEGDRLEIYRPLHTDPKTQRRQKALVQKKSRKK